MSRTERKKQRRELGASEQAKAKRRRLAISLAVAALVVLGLGGGAWYWWYGQGAGQQPRQEGKKGTRGPQVVKVFPSEGDAHVTPGQAVRYRTDPPTSGPHDPEPTPPGFYDRVQRQEKLVHSLEHGNIVIYYDRPDPAVLVTLKKWAARYTGQWSGVVVTPYPGIHRAIILTAWRHMLLLDEFDLVPAETFIDSFRGRGPEKPVR
jgi:hypothetical protein